MHSLRRLCWKGKWKAKARLPRTVTGSMCPGAVANPFAEQGCIAGGTHQAPSQRVEPLHCLIVINHPLHPIHKEHDLTQCWKEKHS